MGVVGRHAAYILVGLVGMAVTGHVVLIQEWVPLHVVAVLVLLVHVLVDIKTIGKGNLSE